jgi:hypothetical protein
MFLGAALSGCSGDGGGDSDGVVFEGTLTQGESVAHDSRIKPKHSAGEKIGEVTVCALGSCSETDSNGQWGFLVEGDFSGGDVAFSFDGHGIATTTIVEVPAGAKNVEIDFLNEGGTIHTHEFLVDGAPHEDHEHAE